MLKTKQNQIKTNFSFKMTIKTVFIQILPMLSSTIMCGIACVILSALVALNPDGGGFVSMGITYALVFVNAFMLTATTVGLILATWSYHYKKQTTNQLIQPIDHHYNSLIAFIYGLILVGLYLACSQLYNLGANSHHNLGFTNIEVQHFDWAICCIILIKPISTYYMSYYNQYYNHTNAWVLILFDLITYSLALGLGYIFSFYVNNSYLYTSNQLGYAAYGLGFSISFIIMMIVSILLAYLKTDLKDHYIGPVVKLSNQFKVMIKHSWVYLFNGLLMSVIKMIMVFAIYLIINDKITASTALVFSSARIIWYHGLIMMPMVANAISDYTIYILQKSKITNNSYHSRQLWLILVILAFVGSFITTIIYGFSVDPMSKIITTNIATPIQLEANIPVYLYPSFKTALLKDQQTVLLLANQSQLSVDQFKANLEADHSLTSDLWLKYTKPYLDHQWHDSYITKTANKTTAPYMVLNSNEVRDYITGSDTIYYLAYFGIGNYTAVVLLRYLDIIKKQTTKPIISTVIQLLTGLFIVGFGVSYQGSDQYHGLVAWSLPFSVLSSVMITLAIVFSCIAFKKYKTKNPYNDQLTKAPWLLNV